MQNSDKPLPGRIVLGTRGSALARKQTERVAELIKLQVPDLTVQVVPIDTAGDRDRTTPLPEIGGTGLFTAALEEALRTGEIDAAVHSLKDLPLEENGDLRLGAIPERIDATDALVSRNHIRFTDLPRGARVGTSSVRRSAQLLARRPDLVVVPIRGNVETRIRKVGDGRFDATVLASAGLVRLGLEQTITERLAWSDMLPAPGQGALAVQYPTHKTAVGRLLALIDDPLVRAGVGAERAFLEALGGGCSSPVGAIATATATPAGIHLILRGTVLGPDGSGAIRIEEEGTDPYELGYRAAREALVRGAGDRLRLHSSLRIEPMPLRGKRVLVTRPEERADDLVRLLRNRGARVVVAPMIRIVAKPFEESFRVLEDAERYDHVVFTSANTVRILLDGSVSGRSGDGIFRSALSSRTVAVGPATAQALRDRGIEPSIVPAVHRAEGLIRELGDLSGRSILLPQGQAAGSGLADNLRAGGATVTHLVIYQTVDADHAVTDRVLRTNVLTEPLEIITFTSGSAARAFAAALRRLGHRIGEGPLAATIVACIGPSTAAATAEAGLPVHVVAERHSNEGLVDALTGKGNENE